MNAVEIEEAVSALAAAPFDAAAFPFQFLAAFGNKDVTIKRLRTRSSNLSDVPGGVLQRANIHLAVAPAGAVGATLAALRDSPKTKAAKAKFILATDGITLEAEDLVSGEALACDYAGFDRHFGVFLPLAGISTVKEIKNNPIDVKATGRLNKLYVELLKDNPDWATEAKRPALNQFMARLIFCFFAEDTGIFHGTYLFTPTIERMSDSQSGNTHEIVGQLFRAMGTPAKDRAAGGFRLWADGFPYVNGGLFTGDADCPRFSKIARAYLLSAGRLDWKEINPDIFGSMIQAVADDAERGALGMHYTSVPNILKVLNPLFLDDLREQLKAAGSNARKLRNLRRRLALLIAEFQADCRHIGQQEARAMVLPLHKTGQIHVGNALRLDWLEVCPPVTKAVVEEWDLAGPTGRLALEENGLSDGVEPETFVCGNPPYVGSTWQTVEQKAEIRAVAGGRTSSPGFLDYVSGWFVKAADWLSAVTGAAAFVSTNSICQGQSVPLLWPIIFAAGCDIQFARKSFKWSNLAANEAGVTVAIIGIDRLRRLEKILFEEDSFGLVHRREGPSISPYLTLSPRVIVAKRDNTISDLAVMEFGNKPTDGGNLLLDSESLRGLRLSAEQHARFIRAIFGSEDYIQGGTRLCLWIKDEDLATAQAIPTIAARIEAVRQVRLASPDKGANALARRAHQLKLMRIGTNHTIIIPGVSSERRPYLPTGLLNARTALTNLAFALYDAPLWNVALIASRIHLVWIATVCGKLKTDFRYSNTLGWNTFPVPPLTAQNKADLTACAETILLAREAHFPATIADLYDPDTMPDNLRQAHDANDETLERIYIGRRFRNDTERLEKLFELYTRMVAATPSRKQR